MSFFQSHGDLILRWFGRWSALWLRGVVRILRKSGWKPYTLSTWEFHCAFIFIGLFWDGDWCIHGFVLSHEASGLLSGGRNDAWCWCWRWCAKTMTIALYWCSTIIGMMLDHWMRTSIDELPLFYDPKWVVRTWCAVKRHKCSICDVLGVIFFWRIRWLQLGGPHRIRWTKRYAIRSLRLRTYCTSIRTEKILSQKKNSHQT